MNDQYDEIFEEIDQTLIYTTENIPTQELQHLFDEEFIGCDCTDLCETNCVCKSKTGAIFINKKLHKLNNNKPIYECNVNCICDKNCGMKLVQFGPIGGLKVKETQNKGLSLIAGVGIAKDCFICEYAGELITPKEAILRFNSYYAKIGMNYIFWLKEFFGDSSIQTIIDPTRIGNIGRFINHSCEANCDLILIRINNLVPKLCVFANRNIEEFEEITFDYGSGESGLVIVSEKDKILCLCGQIKCKKYLPFHNI